MTKILKKSIRTEAKAYKLAYMYVQAYVMDSGSECTIYAVFFWSMSSAKTYV